jgi:hypothetical protein
VVRLLLDRGADIEASSDVSASIWNHTLDSTQLSQTLCEYRSALVTTHRGSSSVSSDDKYSVPVLPISLLGRPVTKCHQCDGNITVQHGIALYCI